MTKGLFGEVQLALLAISPVVVILEICLEVIKLNLRNYHVSMTKRSQEIFKWNLFQQKSKNMPVFNC